MRKQHRRLLSISSLSLHFNYPCFHGTAPFLSLQNPPQTCGPRRRFPHGVLCPTAGPTPHSADIPHCSMMRAPPLLTVHPCCLGTRVVIEGLPTSGLAFAILAMSAVRLSTASGDPRARLVVVVAPVAPSTGRIWTSRFRYGAACGLSHSAEMRDDT